MLPRRWLRLDGRRDGSGPVAAGCAGGTVAGERRENGGRGERGIDMRVSRFSLFRLVGSELVFVRTYASRGGAAAMCNRHPGEYYLSPALPGDEWCSLAA